MIKGAKVMTETFEQLPENNKGKINRICKVYAVSPLEPQDLFQEVIFAIWKSIPTFKGNSSIDTWMYRVTLNVCIRSKQKSEKKYTKTLQLESIQFIPVEIPVVNNQQDKYDALTSCISKLNKENKSIIILYLEELKYKEIAEITGLTENHIAVKIKRIKKLLLNCITNKI
jgi:RNA polymerase sigma-70 factor (ECF subfamily)